jgi:hypothetical protein
MFSDMPKKVESNGTLILGAVVILSGIGTSLVLVGNGSDISTGFIPVIANCIGTLLVLLQAQQNGTKADAAVIKAEEATTVVSAVSDKADAIHGLVNGGLETRLESAIRKVLLTGDADNPPILPPNITKEIS